MFVLIFLNIHNLCIVHLKMLDIWISSLSTVEYSYIKVKKKKKKKKNTCGRYLLNRKRPPREMPVVKRRIISITNAVIGS